MYHQDARNFENSSFGNWYWKSKVWIAGYISKDKTIPDPNMCTTVDRKSASDMNSKESAKTLRTFIMSGFIGAKALMNRPLLQITTGPSSPWIFDTINDDLSMQQGIYESVRSMPQVCRKMNESSVKESKRKTYAQVCASTATSKEPVMNEDESILNQCVRKLKPDISAPSFTETITCAVGHTDSQKLTKFNCCAEQAKTSSLSENCPTLVKENEVDQNVCKDVNECSPVDCILTDDRPVTDAESENSRLRSESECSSLSCVSFLSEAPESPVVMVTPSSIINVETPSRNPILAYILGSESDSDCDSDDSTFSEDESTDAGDVNQSMLDFVIPVGGLVSFEHSGTCSVPVRYGCTLSTSSPLRTSEMSRDCCCNEDNSLHPCAGYRTSNCDEVDSAKFNCGYNAVKCVDKNVINNYLDCDEIAQCVSEANERWNMSYEIEPASDVIAVPSKNQKQVRLFV